MDPEPRVSIIIPAYDEDDAILPVLGRLAESVTLSHEVLIVVDSEDDSTIPAVHAYVADSDGDPVKVLINTYGRGPANAIRYGIDHANSPVLVITMADGCDDPRQVDSLTRLVERGVVVAAASRYMPGGQQVGGPVLKGLMSRAAGKSLAWLARVGTCDATNSFKAYSRDFVRSVGIDSRSGFEIGLELTAKARRLRLPVAEIPTIWLDRTIGESHFEVGKWVPKYLHWYRLAYGKKLSLSQLQQKSMKGSE